MPEIDQQTGHQKSPLHHVRMMPPQQPTLQPLRHLNQVQLAQRWGISPRTLERWRWLGIGPAYLKLVGTVAYRMEDVQAYEKAQRKVAGAR